MKHLKSILLLLLALTTLGGAALAWKQYGELVQLRAIAMNREERADFQKRVWDLEKLNRDLQDRLAAARIPGASEGAAGAADERAPGPRSAGGRGDPANRPDVRQQMEAVRELMAKPEFQALINVQQRAAIEARYGALFRNLNLNDEQTRKLTNLLADRGNVRRDVDEAARAAGIDPRSNPEAFRKLFADAQNELNSAIKSVIGEPGFAQLQTFEQTMPQRTLVDNLQQRLASTGMPLTPQQSEQLVSILAANPAPRALQPAASTTGTPPPARPAADLGMLAAMAGGAPGRGGPDLGGIISGLAGGLGDNRLAGAAPVTPAAVAQAQTVLAPPQLAALQQIQQQQQAQQQLQQLVRDTVTRPPTPAAAPTTPPRKTDKGG